MLISQTNSAHVTSSNFVCYNISINFEFHFKIPVSSLESCLATVLCFIRPQFCLSLPPRPLSSLLWTACSYYSFTFVIIREPTVLKIPFFSLSHLKFLLSSCQPEFFLQTKITFHSKIKQHMLTF